MKRQPSRLPWCGTCDEDSRLIDLDDGRAARCPRCHAKVAAIRANDTTTARARRRLFMDLGLTDEHCPACGERVHHTHRCRASAVTHPPRRLPA